jgi:hypothetical protein
MIEFLDLKTQVRSRIFPTGEAPNLVGAHDKMFVDALIDLQTWVECLQQDNTDVFPQCATFYKCGLTLFPRPRGNIKKIGVIDKVDPTTHLESPDAVSDYCSEIIYREIDYVHFEVFMRTYAMRSDCMACVPLFFGIPGSWQLRWPPTDEGLPQGLTPLKLGVHYAQTNTDRVSGENRWRSRHGVWAKERGNIWVAPWIQSTETIIVKWDGIKRTWGDNDTLDDDPLLIEAVEEYVRWKHADRYDKDPEEATRASAAFSDARTKLVHQCREETRQRPLEVSLARSSVPSLTTLFYNTVQTASGACPDGSHPTSATVLAGSVNSTISVADANQKAKAQAQAQVQAQLDAICGTLGQTWTNTAQTFTAACTQAAGAPPPDGNPITVTIPAGTVTSTVSQADADAQALALAQQQAASQLSCTYWNSLQTASATCPSNPSIVVTKTVVAHSLSSTLSQSDADAKALAQAQNDANNGLTAAGCGDTIFGNTPQVVDVSKVYYNGTLGVNCTIRVRVFVDANFRYSGVSQAQANKYATDYANQYGNTKAAFLASTGVCPFPTQPPYIYHLPE